MDEINSQMELEKLRLDAQLRMEKMRQDVRKVVFGTMIVGLAAAFFPFAQEFARSVFAERIASINTKAEFNRLKEQNEYQKLLETHRHNLESLKQSADTIASRSRYLEQLANEARSERIERQIIIAEFFSFLAEPDMKDQWVGFRDYLNEKQKGLNAEKGEVLARSTDPKLSTAQSGRMQKSDCSR